MLKIMDIREKTDQYFMQSLQNAILFYKNKDYANVNFIRAQLRACCLLLLYQDIISFDELNAIEKFIIEMLGGKTDNGIEKR